MARTATEYVDGVKTEFDGLLREPSFSQFRAYSEACDSGVLDADAVEVFNGSHQHGGLVAGWLSSYIEKAHVQPVIGQRNPDHRIFLPNGYVAYATRRSGIVAVASARDTLSGEPLVDDPVETLYPNYGRKALEKLGKAVLDADAPSGLSRLVWSAQGHVYGRDRDNGSESYCAASGMLFAHPIEGLADSARFEDVRDIRAELLAVPGVAETAARVSDVDILAGLADRTIAKAYANSHTLNLFLEDIQDDAAKLVAQGVYLH